MPRLMASTRPTARRTRLGATSFQNRSPTHVSTKVLASVTGSVTKKLSELTVMAYQTAMISAGRPSR